MTNERRNEGSDPLVRDTYKALSNERVTDSLNDRVLKQAAKAGRSRYSLTRAWTRPVAWAATIGLSLAIVLELTRLPQTETDVIGISAPEVSMPGELRETADTLDGPQASGTTPDNVATPEPSRPATPATQRRNDASMDDFVPRELTVLQDAENMARIQAGAKNAPVAVTRTADTVREAEESAVAENQALESDYACPEKSRESAESWFACIEQLRTDGLADRAASEYEKFRRKFPDFKDSTADR